MPRELPGYRENLQDVLEFFHGKRLLTVLDVGSYTGMKNYDSIKRRFPFKDRYISAVNLALCLSGGVPKE